jgi:phenylalanyl-tRNA synthetase beta chain
MLISYQWLCELLPGLTHNPSQVAGLLTDHSFETVVSHSFAIDPQVITAKITNIQPHPNADRLQLVTIDTGSTQATVVCGAHNIQVGDIVPYSPTGTKLFDDQGKIFTLAPAKIRGIVSAGMLNSPRELGLGDSHHGIYLLPPATSVGTSLADHLPPDTILDADITPNRAHDCQSHIGIARELAAILNLPLPEKTIPPLPQITAEKWQLNIDRPDQVMRYIGLVFHQVHIQPSPLWLQAKLWAMGSKPINNVVDITNYVLFETGYPSHAFDSTKLPEPTVGVRFARTNESLATLDNLPHALNPKNLVISSGDQAVALAGIMGGQDSQVVDTTEQVFLETAAFHPYTIQQSAESLKLDTESSRRFSKGLTPALVSAVSDRAAALLLELTGAKLIGRMEYYPSPVAPKVIKFNPQRVSVMAGQPFTDQGIKDALIRLRCQVKTASTWTVILPPERLDLNGEHDLIEEVIRLAGVQQITSHPPHILEHGPALPDLVQWREAIRDILVTYNLTETSNYSFSDQVNERLLGLSPDQTALTLTNPVAPEQDHLRTTLLPRLSGNLLANKSEWRTKFSHKETGLFEIGTIFRAGFGGVVASVVEEEHIGIALVGEHADEQTAYDIIAEVSQSLGIKTPPADLVTVKVQSAASPIYRKLGLPVVFIEMNLSLLLPHATRQPAYTPAASGPIAIYQSASKFPPVYRDISLLVDGHVSSEEVVAIITKVAGKSIQAVDLFDTYQPANSSQKGLAFHVAYQAQDRTLNDADVNRLHQEVGQALRNELQAQLR